MRDVINQAQHTFTPARRGRIQRWVLILCFAVSVALLLMWSELVTAVGIVRQVEQAATKKFEKSAGPFGRELCEVYAL